MTVTSSEEFKPALSTRHLPAPEVRDLPEPPRKMGRLIGPGMVGAGVGLASGEFIFWPTISAQIGLTFLWGALLGVTLQWYLNTEIQRYTLATGETSLTGFNRMWPHFGLVFVVMCYLESMWPGWATSSATMFTYLFGGDPTVVAIVMLVVTGAILTLAPRVYVALERLITVKVIVMGLFFVVAAIFVIKPDTWRTLPEAATHVGQVPTHLGAGLIMAAVAFAGAGGTQNLCQSNWIRDKGFGMGQYVPRLVSPLTGEKVAAAQEGTAFVFEPTPENMTRWQRWWRFAKLEQFLTFGVMTVLTIAFTSMLAHSTVFGLPNLPDDVSFLKLEGLQLGKAVGGWFTVLFWVVGAFSLFAASVGIVDYPSRLAADVLKTRYLRNSSISESKLYVVLVWSLVGLGILVLMLGLDQPLVLLIASAVLSGLSMTLYSTLLLVNRKALPKQIRTRGFRTGVLVFCILFYGSLFVITAWDEISGLLG